MVEVAKVLSVAPIGFEGQIIEVEADASKGLPSLQIVGLGNKAVDESKERVRSAIKNSLLDFPARKLTINLAPAELPKDGTHYDLSIALAILTTSGQIRQEQISGAAFAGELALDGSLRPIRGVITVCETAKKAGCTHVYIPSQNIEQASLVDGITVTGVSSLKELFLHLKQEARIKTAATRRSHTDQTLGGPTLDEIYGQETAKRALVIAAAGHHNLLLSGPPGTGKTMLAKALANLLPELSREEAIAVTKLHSLAGESIDAIVTKRPFRAPHHTASRVALVGGGNRPQPGEISLAHLGVLFLDEIPEYPRASLEALRQPLEDKTISISRAQGKSSYPADFMLIATMNPCPCGHYGDSAHECSCSTGQILAYQKRLSGPFLDRIDLMTTVPRVSNQTLLDHSSNTNLQHLSALTSIKNALAIQNDRYKSSMKNNSNLTSSELKQFAELAPASRGILEAATNRLSLSTRAYFKVIKVARTIADLESSSAIEPAHVAEALQYRLNSP